MKVKYIILAVSAVICLSSFYFYKKYVLDFEKMPAKIIFERETEVKEVEKELVNIFVPDDDMERLELVEVEIKTPNNVNEKAVQVFDKIIEKIDFVDEELRLMSVYYINGELYLNLNAKFLEFLEDDKTEIMLIYSIVNSMTEIPKVDRVKFLVENKEVDSGNNFLMWKFFTRDTNI